MRTVQIGNVSSEKELEEATNAASAEYQALDMTEFLVSLARIEKSGFSREAKRWRNTADPTVKVFSSTDIPFGQGGLWAAIDIGADGQRVTLLKITTKYNGGNREHDELFADAIHRKTHGRLT